MYLQKGGKCYNLKKTEYGEMHNSPPSKINWSVWWWTLLAMFWIWYTCRRWIYLRKRLSILKYSNTRLDILMTKQKKGKVDPDLWLDINIFSYWKNLIIITLMEESNVESLQVKRWALLDVEFIRVTSTHRCIRKL